jgi:hypothetical protein
VRKGKAIPVTGRGGEGSRLPYFLDNMLIDGDEVVGVMHRPPFTPSSIPGTDFCEMLNGPNYAYGFIIIRYALSYLNTDIHSENASDGKHLNT